MRCRLLGRGGAAALLLSPGGFAHSQTPDDPGGETILHLHGIVRNGLTGKPLARALVRSSDQRIATMTTSEGLFAFDIRIKESMSYSGAAMGLSATKPGYVADGAYNPSALTEAISPAGVDLSLMPVASVSGQVSASVSEAPENVRVMLLAHIVEDGARTWRTVASQNTNSQGRFHFGDLRPGEYTVLTGEWRDDNLIPQVRDGVSMEYPPDFLGDVNALGGASKLQLGYGDQTEVELHLQPANYYPVRMPVVAFAGNAPVNVQVGTSGSFDAYSLSYNSRTHLIEGSLPTGDYTLNLTSFGQPQMFAETVIHVDNAPYRSAGVALSPGTTIPIRVQTQFTHPDTGPVYFTFDSPGGGTPQPPVVMPSIHLFLRSTEGSHVQGFFQANATGEGELKLENVAPGTYTVNVQPMRGYVASVTCGGVDLKTNPLQIVNNARPQPIEVILRDDFGTVAGTLSLNNESSAPNHPVFVLLVPADGKGSLLQGFVGAEGKFQLSAVPPGSYVAFAVRGQPPQIAWHDEKTTQALASKVATVTVSAGQTVQVQVPVLDPAKLTED